MRKIVLFILSATVSCLFAQQLAFPEAEGFGRYAIGGRGGKVVTVTSLQDYTSSQTPIEGTLRWALEQYKHTEEIDGKTITVYEPLTIVFNVAGNITLLEDLKVKRDYLTIAGQSAPGDGVCITGHSMLFNGATGGEMWYWGPRRKHIIVRYMRFRPTIPTDQSYVTYGTDVENYEQVIFDHCTMTWANEECLAIYDNKNTTVQYCLVAEGLYSANHKKGQRSYCGVWGGQFASYHHNLIAHNDSRNVRFNGARTADTLAVIDFHNNVIYNWGGNGANAEGLESSPKSDKNNPIDPAITRNELNMVNNYYKHGPASGYSAGAKASYNKAVNRFFRTNFTQAMIDEGYTSQHYVAGNYMSNFADVTADNWWCGVQFKNFSDTAAAKKIFRKSAMSKEVAEQTAGLIQTAEQAYETVLEEVGACLPKRDFQDARIINETKEGIATGEGSRKLKGIIDDPQAVGGWPQLSGTPYTDTDKDGIPDTWEKANGLNPNNADDGALITESGYSNLELYLNSIKLVSTGIDDAVGNEHKAHYILKDGQLLIQTDRTYTLSGQLTDQPK